MLFASALKLLNASNAELLGGVIAALVVGIFGWAGVRRANGLPGFARSERPDRSRSCRGQRPTSRRGRDQYPTWNIGSWDISRKPPVNRVSR